MSEIIIVGAGASGLIAARELSRAGKKVRILEAQDRIGGRIHTLSEEGFSAPVELGAEFIHGNQKITLDLLQEYKIPYHKIEGSMLRSRQGKFSQLTDVIPHSQVLAEKLKKIKEDMSVETFLQLYFAEEKYQELAESVRSFVKGFDAADPSKASILAFRKEWLSEQDDDQYRIEGGYIRLINALWKECKQRSVKLELNAPVKEVKWGHHVEVITAQHSYTTSKALLTLPLGMLKNETSLRFTPALPDKARVATLLGTGSVLKILLEFKEAFWKKLAVQYHTNTALENFSFLFSDELVPTWWTQYPHSSTLLTGWLSGPAAEYYIGNEATLLDEALESLSKLFKIQVETLKKQLVAWKAVNWQHDPFAQGAYSYTVVNGDVLVQELLQPIENQLFFAGEALNTDHTGTVEAALSSGMSVAETLLLSIQNHAIVP